MVEPTQYASRHVYVDHMNAPIGQTECRIDDESQAGHVAREDVSFRRAAVINTSLIRLRGEDTISGEPLLGPALLTTSTRPSKTDLPSSAASTARRRRRTPESARREILAAAEGLLTERDFHELSVAAVMAAAEMSRPTFYHYFEDLGDLLIALLAEAQAELLASAEPWLTGAATGPAALAEAITGSAKVWIAHRHVLLAAHDGAAQNPRLAAHYRTIIGEWAAVTGKRLRAERRQGRTALRDPDGTASALTLMNINVFAEHLGRREGARPAKVSGVLSSIWISTIYPDAPDASPAHDRGPKEQEHGEGFQRQD